MASRVIAMREIGLDDAEAVARLSGELGYPATADEMKRRILHLQSARDHVVFVACSSDVVVAWIDVGIIHHLQAEPRGEIGGLVVSEGHRNRGIGRQLLAKAEEWARQQGMAEMQVRSRITREDAHRFYRREGYQQTKTSAVFSKPLA